MNKKNAIFIHSLFRTGSTYIWNKFRQSGVYRCYYEPFHQELAFLEAENPDRWNSTPDVAASMGHPLLDREYMHEYRHLLRPGQKGVPFFKKSFSFDDFCNNGSNPDQKKYIDFLLENCGGQTPLLQFNRSALRIRWFRKNFPDALHIYLLRAPREQFSAYLWLREKKNLDIFLIMDLLTVSVNKKKCAAFKDLAGSIPLIGYNDSDFRREEAFYRHLLGRYSLPEKYLLHYFIWFAAFLENLEHADLLMNINLLSDSESYRNKIARFLNEKGVSPITFSDARVGSHRDFFIEESAGRRMEENAQNLILRHLPRSKLRHLLSRLDDENRTHLQIDLEQWRRLRRRKFAFSEAVSATIRTVRFFCLAGQRFFPRGSPAAKQAQSPGAARLSGGLRLAGFQKKSQPGFPLLTVVIVVLNETETLARTITSVLQQSYANIELIVIDGGSAKPTLDIIKKFEDKIDYWLSEPDCGIFDAMNKGIALAGGEWIHFLNCGDHFYRNDTVAAVFSLDCNEADFIYGHTDFLGGDFRGVVKAWSFDILWKTMIFTHQSLFTRARFLKAGKFDTRFRICADYKMIYNAYCQGKKFFNSAIVIASFDPGFSDVSRSRMAWEKWRVVKAHRNDPAFHWFYLQLFVKRFFRDIGRRLFSSRRKRGQPEA